MDRVDEVDVAVNFREEESLCEVLLQPLQVYVHALRQEHVLTETLIALTPLKLYFRSILRDLHLVIHLLTLYHKNCVELLVIVRIVCQEEADLEVFERTLEHLIFGAIIDNLAGRNIDYVNVSYVTGLTLRFNLIVFVDFVVDEYVLIAQEVYLLH